MNDITIINDIVTNDKALLIITLFFTYPLLFVSSWWIGKLEIDAWDIEVVGNGTLVFVNAIVLSGLIDNWYIRLFIFPILLFINFLILCYFNYKGELARQKSPKRLRYSKYAKYDIYRQEIEKDWGIKRK